MRGWHKYFVLISVIFLIIALYRGEYFHLPVIHNVPLLISSLVLLIFAFGSASVTWYLILNRSEYPVRYIDALFSHFLSIFGKYIPGKFWAVFGRSVYINDKLGYPLHKVSTLSGINQLQVTWSGFAFGIIGALLLNLEWYINALLLIGWLLLTILLFSRVCYDYLQSIINFTFKKNYKLPFVGIRQTMFYIPFLILHWTIWFVAFYIFVLSV